MIELTTYQVNPTTQSIAAIKHKHVPCLINKDHRF